jgi:hypothetical protein
MSLEFPILLRFLCQDFSTDVGAVSFSAASPQELIGNERMVRISHKGPPGRCIVDNVPRWLECKIQQESDSASTLCLKVKEVPSKPFELSTLHIGRVGVRGPRADLLVSAFYSPR